jgi:hypothetical protein
MIYFNSCAIMRKNRIIPESVNHNRQEAQQKPVGYGKMEGVHGKITAPDG